MSEQRYATRRGFLEGASTLGLGALLLPGLLAKGALAAPNKGGHLIVGSDGGAVADTMNPQVAIGTDHVTQAVLACYDNLTEIAPDGTAIPSLAEDWEVSDDGKTWRFRLRGGVEFHNAKSLTPADVIWSFQQHLGPEGKFAEAKQIVGNFEEMRGEGDTLVLVQKQVNYDLPSHLASFGLIVAPEGTENWDAGIGTGPYALEAWEPGQRFLGRKFANYHRNDDGHVASLELLNIADATARTAALLSGEVHAIGSPDTKTVGRMTDRADFELIEVSGNQHFTTAMRTDLDPFTDNHLRMAVKFGLKRQEIVDKVLGGFGYPGNDHPIGRSVQFHNSALPQRAYDPDQAKWHLKQAGLESIDLEFQTSDGAFVGAVDMGVLMRESLAPAGLSVEVARKPADGYWSDVWLKAPWCAVYWNGRPTVDWMLSTAYISSSSWNDTAFKNPTFDQILIAARGERDQDKRRQMYYDLQEILNLEGGTTVVAFASYLVAASSELGHGPVGSYRRLDDNRLGRRWWFRA